MERHFVSFDLVSEVRFFLAPLGISMEEFTKHQFEDPSVDLSTALLSRLSLKQASDVWQLNRLVSRFELEVVAIWPIEDGIRVWAKTPMWRNFQYNWRRVFQREVSGDLCPACLKDATRMEDACPSCGQALVWLTGGAILKED